MVQCDALPRVVFGLNRPKMAQSMHPVCIPRCRDSWFARIGFRSRGYIPDSHDQIRLSVAKVPPTKTRLSGSSVRARRLREAWRRSYVGMVEAALLLLF